MAQGFTDNLWLCPTQQHETGKDELSDNDFELASSGSRSISGSADIASGQPTRALFCLLNTHSEGGIAR